MKQLEERIKRRGYELVDETPPFRIYEKHRKRIIYHTPSDKIWGHFVIKNMDKDEYE